ncbi:hypothetical protein Cantr_00880 [Candida viswanathii]|uniref:Uncharacterized protein n=1 Tax=Candida viswanathii TaxID=5486 RepID=A0A367YIR0_9ASCO|nr:hypothetical protein Cantr_00880 [Candida viswanathii]
MVEPRYPEFEEEFDDTYIETPERRATKTAHQDKPTTNTNTNTNTNFTSFRAPPPPRGSSPLRKPPITRTDMGSLITPELNEGLKENVPDRLEDLPSLSNSPNSPPTSMRFNKRLRSEDIESVVGINGVNKRRSTESSPIKNRFMESLRKRRVLARGTVRDNAVEDLSSSSSPPPPPLRRGGVMAASPPAKSSEEESQEKYSQGILDRVNSTLEELHHDEIQKRKATSPRVLAVKHLSPKVYSPRLLPLSEPSRNEDMHQEEFMRRELLGNSTPIHKELRATSSESEQMELQAAWWPYLKWAKLKRVVMLKDITREEAINNTFLMNQLECVNRAELMKRYDFLAKFKPKRANGSGIKKNGRISKRSHE